LLFANRMPSVILATAGYDHNIRFWEATSGICYRSIQCAESQINRLEISPDKQYIAAAGNPQIKFFELNTNNTNSVMNFEGHTTNVTGIGFQKDGKWMFSSSEDGTLKIWDIRAPGSQREFSNNTAINTVCLHPNQAELITGDQNGSIKIWDLVASECTRELVPDGEVAIRSVTVAGDGSAIVAANNKGNCFVWKLFGEDTSKVESIQKIESAHSTYILKCLFSPDSKLLATTSADHTAKIWNVSKDKDKDLLTQSKTLQGHQRWVWDCAFSTDSAYLVTASSDQVARLWDLSQGDSIRHYTGHHKAVSCIALRDC